MFVSGIIIIPADPLKDSLDQLEIQHFKMFSAKSNWLEMVPDC